VLAHEVFHWWNDSRLTAADAMWFREGLTEYYGIRVAREVGASTPDAEAACLADLNGEMRLLEENGARSLKDASLDPAATRLVYSKGALFWLLVDRRLRASERFLEDAVRRVVTSPREGLTTEELRTLFSSVYDGLVDDEFDRYVIGANRLPDLGLGPATGRSGCARELTKKGRF
jgi:predicted metalloprotease with PDZ domain